MGYIFSVIIYWVLIWRLNSRNITSENNYKLRDRISDFWVGKSPDFKYFYRKEISICDRLTIL